MSEPSARRATRLPRRPSSNREPRTHLPERCDVLVVGAGPAGSAAARTLARAGRRRGAGRPAQAFPRDKVCGDGLIPDAHHGLAPARRARRGDGAGAARRRTSPASARAAAASTCPARSPCCRGAQLDDVLCRAAVAAGARMHAPLRFVAPLEDGDGARGRRAPAGRRATRAPCAPTGSCSPPARCRRRCWPPACRERHTPSGVALRGYVRNAAMVGRIAGARGRLASRARAGLRLDLPRPGRRLQHRRRRGREPPDRARRQARQARGATCARCSTTSAASTRRRASCCAGGEMLGAAEGRAAALLARAARGLRARACS